MTRSSRRTSARSSAASENDDDAEASGRGRRSTRARNQTVFFADSAQQASSDRDSDDSDEDASEGSGESEEEEEAMPARRKSSRATAFKGGMKDPSNSIADLLKAVDEPVAGGGAKKRRGARAKRSSLEGNGSDDDEDEDDDDMYESPKKKRPARKAVVKSPAKRHSRRRMSKKLEYREPESSEEESSEDEESEVDSDEEEEEEMKISKVIACQSLTLKEWKEVCAKMNTSEVTNGSRWIQDEPDESQPVDEEKYEERFLCKWNDMSFLHCSWETEKDLVNLCDGAKTRLSTFFRKAEGGLLYEPDERLDGDYFDPSWTTIERIMEVKDGGEGEDGEEAAEIILDVNDPNFDAGTGRQFFIKWVNMPYTESTYEFERDLILNEVDYEEHLDSFNRRKVKPTKEDMRRRDKESDVQQRKLYKIFGDKIKQSDEAKEEQVKEYQKELENRVFQNGGQLRDYQAEGVSWLMSNHLNKRSSILADEMGLGKTIQTATYVYTVSQQLATRGPFLIVAPLSTIPHWYREFTGWTDLNTIVYHGSANDRELVREQEFPFPEDQVQNVAFNQRYLNKVAKRWKAKWEKTWQVEVVITTPEMLVTDDFAELACVKWEIMVVDEAHRLKNHNSKLAQNLRDGRFDFQHSLLLTGTPIQNNMQELWTLLNFINPDTFDDLDGFMEQYGDIKSKERVDELHETIRPYILRRLKEDVEKSVPPKEETLIEVELTVLQKQYYRALYEKNLKFLHRNKKKPLDGPSINNLAMQLRKCCNHPFLLTGVETEVRSQNPDADVVESMVNASGKFVLLDKLLPRLKADGHRILLFSQFKIMLDIIEDYLHLRDFKCERIDGSITGLKRQAAIDRFQSKDNATNGREQPFIMLLSTRAGGVGINLTAADTCIIFDSDWNPQNDLQAQARCHRIGQTKNVKVYRLLTRKTYEMQMFHMSSMKMGLDQAVLQGIENNAGKDIMTKEEVEKLLKHGAYDIFAEDKDGTSEKESNDFVSQDIDSILARRAKTVVHENTGSNSAAAGGTFSKASFKNTNSDGVATEEVDVDDPEFWTKVVGEVKDQEEAVELGKRKRDKPQYSEKEYLKRLDREIQFGVDGGSDVEAVDNESSSEEYSDSGGESDDEYLNLDNDAMKIINKATKSKKKDERYRWGGGGPSEWKQSDADAVLKALQLYGYGNISWEKFNAHLTLSNPMKPQEVKRMAWSLALLCLHETAEDEALEATRKAEAAAATKEKQPAGDVLARTGDGNDDEADKEDTPMEDADKGPCESEEKAEEGKGADGEKEPSKPSDDKPEEKKDQLAESFKEILSANEPWAQLALADALAFSKTAAATPRDKKYVQSIIDGHRPTKGAVEENAYHVELTTKFNENIWPGLRSRGWKNDEKKTAKGYTYQGKTFKSILSVIDAIPKYHPELMNMANSLITSMAATCKDAASPPVATLDPKTLTAKSLKSFLMDCAPLQLLVDRKSAHRLHLPKRLMTLLTQVRGMHKLVSKADSNMPPESTPEERNVQLSKLINISARISKPHPEWTLVHDAILIRAVTKHGWIDKTGAITAIAKDKSIRWGAPFEAVPDADKEKKEKAAEDPEVEKKFQADYDRVFESASRAANYLQKLNASFAEGLPAPVLNEINDRLIKSFGIVKSTDDDGNETWKVDEEALKKILRPPEEKAADNCEDLPSKKALVKRMRRLAMAVTGRGSAPEEEKEEPQENSEKTSKVEAKSYGYHIIDQSDRNTILLAEMVRGQLYTKQTVKVGVVKDYGSLVFDELGALKDLAKAEENDAVVQVMKKTKKDVELYLNTFRKTPRAAKNILRVMLGIDPSQPKVETEPLFASETEKTSSATASAKAALTKQKKKKAFTSADSALNRALASFVEDKDGIKDCLLLTSTEILMLTVLASQGLPVFSDDWKSLVNMDMTAEEEDDEFTIYFSASAGIMQAAAEVWLSVAKTKLTAEIQRHGEDMSALSERDRTKIAVLKKDMDFKKQTLEEAKAYNNEPLEFAKRCIMLVEAVRKNMGPVDLTYAGEKKTRQLNKSENGLGTKVLNWMSKDLRKWAGPLCATDDDGNVLPTTSITKKKDHPQSHDAALMTKRDCRTVFIQIAQQTRLRSIFTKNKMARLSDELIPKVLNQSTFAMTEWDERPAWWNEARMEDSSCSCQDDLDLLVGILEYGYGGYDSMLQHDYSFCKRAATEGNGESKALTRSSVQVRINHLTRELHAVDETEEMMKLVQKKSSAPKSAKKSDSASSSGKAKKKSGGVIQSGLEAFFSKKKQKTSSSKTPPTSPEGTSDVEVIEIDSDGGSGSKRKSVFDQVEVADKKQK